MRPFRAIGALLLFAVALAAQADYHFDASKKSDISDEDQQLAAEIAVFLKEYEAAYNNQDYRKVKSMWVADGNPIYMAEEVPFPLYGKSRIDNYFNPVPGRKILEGIDNRYSEVRAKYVAPNVAVATYRLDYDLKLVRMPAVGGWDRVMAVFVKGDDGWRLSAYTEAPMAPGTMIRKKMKDQPAETEEQKEAYKITRDTIRSLNEGAVSEGFDEFLEARKDQEPTH